MTIGGMGRTGDMEEPPGKAAAAKIGRPTGLNIGAFRDGGVLRHLISGAAGFIGSHLCDRLLADGGTVVAVDNLITGSRRNLLHLADHPRFQFFEFDVTNPVTVSGEFDGEFDHVWHLASLASPMAYLAHPIETLESGS